MTLPNKLTVTRIMFSPVFFLIFILSNQTSGLISKVLLIAAWCIFAYGEISDVLDGYIARKYSLVSDLGKIMDPFADVVSRLTYFLCFVIIGIMPVFAFYIILLRELIVTFIRMVLIKSGTAMAASIWGKVKAVIYFISSTLAFFYYTFSYLLGENVLPVVKSIILALFVLSAIAAFFSLTDYFIKFTKTTTFKEIKDE